MTINVKDKPHPVAPVVAPETVELAEVVRKRKPTVPPADTMADHDALQADVTKVRA